ncbi:G protein pathway suppressor 2-like [Uloborus diversus]|uniref:G protein pathway suppressor 2-like n=1 Tax=Uloborus diversus TaxID=327109 RepID=UPI0024092AB0|nr:G protein pathway suppressor 2-like [Uloborus diversus]
MPALIERPKMSLAMWAALKSHIMKQREKKKQEQEADAAVERLRREQEMKRKQNAMTLEEIREQIAELEKKLNDLKMEKHNLFLYLKRVLNNEEDKRRSEEDKEASELLQMGHHYINQNVPVGAPNLYMIAGNNALNRNQVMFKVGNPTPQQNGAIKRQRSPSPPNPNYSQGYNFKTHSTYGQTYGMPHPTGQYAPQDQTKHLAAGYHVTHLPQQGYVSSLPQQIEHAAQKQNNIQEEKYYIQQGGISSGYPIRSQPQAPSRFQPPTTHNVTAPMQVPIRKEDVMRRSINEAHR